MKWGVTCTLLYWWNSKLPTNLCFIFRTSAQDSTSVAGETGTLWSQGRKQDSRSSLSVQFQELEMCSVNSVQFSSVQFSSVAQSCPTLCEPMDCSTPGLPVHHQFPEVAQTHVHRVGDAIQPSHSLLSPSPPAFNLSQHQGLFQWVNSLHYVAKIMKVKSNAVKNNYSIGTWNVRSMNQSKLIVFKQEVARVNINILGIGELKWIGMGKFSSDVHYIYYCGQESLRRNGVAFIVNRNLKCSTWV